MGGVVRPAKVACRCLPDDERGEKAAVVGMLTERWFSSGKYHPNLWVEVDITYFGCM
jgi:hypothetical protein